MKEETGFSIIGGDVWESNPPETPIGAPRPGLKPGDSTSYQSSPRNQAVKL